MSKFFVTGGSGRLGKEIQKLRPDWIYPSSQELDVTYLDDIYKWARQLDHMDQIDGCLHLAAMTNVPECEKDREKAFQTNAVGTRYMAHMFREYPHDIKFVYMSTPCVFSGEHGPYSEFDMPSPSNFYGLTKLLGEAIASTLHRYLILRANFVPREPWPYPKAFTDRYGTYLYADTLAKAIVNECENVGGHYNKGIIHLCGDKDMTMYDLAKLASPDVQPITTIEYVQEQLKNRESGQERIVHLTQDMRLISNKRNPIPFT